jgi:hypothetical protein
MCALTFARGVEYWELTILTVLKSLVIRVWSGGGSWSSAVIANMILRGLWVSLLAGEKR